MMSASVSASSLRSLANSKSLASFTTELASAQLFAEVANSGATARVKRRPRVRPESILPGLMFAKPSQRAVDESIELEPTVTESNVESSTSIASMSSSKSLNSFKRDLFETGRLGELNSCGFEARAYRRRVRSTSVVQPEPTPKPTIGVNKAAGVSTASMRLPLAERSPFVQYTPSGSLSLTSVRDRSGKWVGATPSFFADLEPEQEFRLGSALLLPAMQFTSGTVGAEKSDVLRSIMGEPADEKTSRVGKLLQAFKRTA